MVLRVDIKTVNCEKPGVQQIQPSVKFYSIKQYLTLFHFILKTKSVRPPKRWYAFTRLYGVIIQKTEICMFPSMTTSVPQFELSISSHVRNYVQIKKDLFYNIFS
jgi:hypothetical protein